MPTSRAAASAAASVVRTSSSARLRSGRSDCWSLIAPQPMTTGALRDARWLAHDAVLRLAAHRPGEHQDRAEDGDVPAPLQLDLRARIARAVDEPVVEEQAERGDRDDRGDLAARPRQRVIAHDDAGE